MPHPPPQSNWWRQGFKMIVIPAIDLKDGRCVRLKQGLMSKETVYSEIPEEMAAFFDARAAGYDDHMRDNVFTDTTFAQFYQAVSAPIEETHEPLKILDLGCGTGLEIEALFQPLARRTGFALAYEHNATREISVQHPHPRSIGPGSLDGSIEMQLARLPSTHSHAAPATSGSTA